MPGLAAEPIVDIVVGIDDPDDESAFVPDLEAAGYELRVREPGHRCFRTGDPDEPVNLHCYPPPMRRYADTCCSVTGSALTRQTGPATRR